MAERIRHLPGEIDATGKRGPGRPAGNGTKSNLIISLRPDHEQTAWLQARTAEPFEAARHGLMRESFDRYRALLALGARECGGIFTPREFLALCDACNGTLFEAATIKYLHVQIEDADQYEALGERHNVDAASLAARIEALPASATFALSDAVERFWNASSRGEDLGEGAEMMARLGIAPAEGI